MTAVTVPAYAAPGVEVNGDLNLSGTGTISFPDGSKQITAACRYEDNGDGTVTDCRSGLIWLKNANCAGQKSWAEAVAWAAALATSACGLTDGSIAGEWRLPTRLEWMAMTATAQKRYYYSPTLTNAAGTAQWTEGNPFSNVQSWAYWSSTTDASDASGAWFYDMILSTISGAYKTASAFVWPVRRVP